MTWLAITGGGAQTPSDAAHPGSLVLSPDIGRFVMQAFAWLFAIPLDAIALGAWFDRPAMARAATPP